MQIRQAEGTQRQEFVGFFASRTEGERAASDYLDQRRREATKPVSGSSSAKGPSVQTAAKSEKRETASKRELTSAIPILHKRPSRGSRCGDCESTLVEADAFYLRSSGEIIYVCQQCRDRRIRHKRVDQRLENRNLGTNRRLGTDGTFPQGTV